MTRHTDLILDYLIAQTDEQLHPGLSILSLRCPWLDYEPILHSLDLIDYASLGMASVVCMPTFTPPWAIRMHKAGEARFSIVLTEAKKRIQHWDHLDADPVERFTAELESSLARDVYVKWRLALLQTRYQYQGIGGDGTRYYFHCEGSQGYGLLEGSTWSPNPESPAGRLVAAAEALHDYVRSTSTSVEAGLKKLQHALQRA